jgi:DNA-binding beta-propeller fold protein YncE
VDLSALNPPALTHVAVSDDGGLLVYSIAETDRESLYVWTPSGSSRFVFSVSAVGDIAIAGNGAAYITDRFANEFFVIADPRNSAIAQYLLGERDGVSKPTGIAISNGDTIYIANTGSGTVMTLDFGGHLLRTLQCDCRLSGLYPLRDSVFLLTDRLDQTIYLLATSLNGDQVSFVPAMRTNP